MRRSPAKHARRIARAAAFAGAGLISPAALAGAFNQEEGRGQIIFSQMFATGTNNDLDFARHLLNDQPQLELVCVTRGANGCLAVSRSEAVDVPGIAVQVVDTVGAGDSFTAALIQTRLAGWTLRRSVEFANRVGALVASRPGAMPVLRVELAALRREFS